MSAHKTVVGSAGRLGGTVHKGRWRPVATVVHAYLLTNMSTAKHPIVTASW
jgi:hypothetical protein